MYKEFVLDESILDLESWLPQSAIDEVVALILHLEEQEENNLAVSFLVLCLADYALLSVQTYLAPDITMLFEVLKQLKN